MNKAERGGINENKMKQKIIKSVGMWNKKNREVERENKSNRTSKMCDNGKRKWEKIEENQSGKGREINQSENEDSERDK